MWHLHKIMYLNSRASWWYQWLAFQLDKYILVKVIHETVCQTPLCWAWRTLEAMVKDARLRQRDVPKLVPKQKPFQLFARFWSMLRRGLVPSSAGVSASLISVAKICVKEILQNGCGEGIFGLWKIEIGLMALLPVAEGERCGRGGRGG